MDLTDIQAMAADFRGKAAAAQVPETTKNQKR
jgi:hypothetical protein